MPGPIFDEEDPWGAEGDYKQGYEDGYEAGHSDGVNEGGAFDHQEEKIESEILQNYVDKFPAWVSD